MGFFDLTGQSAIVTGAATGIGEAIARRLSAAGASVAIADIDEAGAQVIAADLPNAMAVKIDISSADSVAKAIAAVEAKYGKIDILVNNAGIAGKAGPISDQTEEEWRRVVDINLIGVFLCTRAVM